MTQKHRVLSTEGNGDSLISGRVPLQMTEGQRVLFWSKVSKSSEAACWPWTGRIDRDGYGRLKHAGKQLFAHRAAYTLENGPIPTGLILRHSCDTPGCCNPAHLLPGTHADNTQDKVSRGRHVVGEDVAQAQLSADQVLAIRRRIAAGETLASIAPDFGVSDRTIWSIKSRRTWDHLPDEAVVVSPASTDLVQTVGAESPPSGCATGAPTPDHDLPIVTHVIVATDDLHDMLHAAWLSGALAVHEELKGPEWPEGCDPEFGEAAGDYVASLDFTETTRPLRPTEWTTAADLLVSAVEERAEKLAKKASESLYEDLMYGVQEYLRENTLWNLKHELKMAQRLAAERWQTLLAIAKLLGVGSYPASEIPDAIERLQTKAALLKATESTSPPESGSQ